MTTRLYLPTKTAEEARERMSIRSRRPPFRKRVIEKLELIGVPHYWFEVEVKDGPTSRTQAVGVEAVEGTVAMLEPGAKFGEAPALLLPMVLTREEAEVRARADFRWMLLSRALKRKQGYQIAAVTGGELFFYPYWVGYYRRGDRWDFEAVDAVSGMAQGSTMRRVILKALVLMGKEEA